MNEDVLVKMNHYLIFSNEKRNLPNRYKFNNNIILLRVNDFHINIWTDKYYNKYIYFLFFLIN